MWWLVDDRGVAIGVVLCISGLVVVLHEVIRIGRTPERSTMHRWAALVAVWWAAAVGFVTKSVVSSSPPAKAEASDADGVIAGALASSVVSHILTRRREQMRLRRVPDRLTQDESRALGSIMSSARTSSVGAGDFDPAACPDQAVRAVLDAVERTGPADQPTSVVAEWSAVLRVYGAPRLESRTGEPLEYRKSRALELTAWLAFNRDRQSRSAARTAIWDIEVSDATFSTVVSDLRRTLTTIDPDVEPGSWLPTTYTDEIALSNLVTTDADLLRRALVSFESSPSVDAELFDVLGMVRDVPFAGTRWSWADLDGTTTRLVILAVDASIAAARFAEESGRADLLEVAVTSGMRVMPGCPELVAIQQSFLSRVSMSR